MNIVLATHGYPVFERTDLTGDVDALHNFTKFWASQGHQVTVLHLYQHGNRKGFFKPPFFYRFRVSESVHDGVRVICIESRFVVHLKNWTRSFKKKIAQNCGTYVKDPDLLLVHFPVALCDFGENLPFSCPRAGILHNTDLVKLAGAQGQTYYHMLNRSYDALGFRSMKLKRLFEGMGGSRLPSFMVYSGAPVAQGEKHDIRMHHPVRILYAGKLTVRKQADLVIRALAKIRNEVDFVLTIAGDGPERMRFEALTARLGLSDRIVFTGAVPREQILSLMAQQDIFAMISYAETFGLVYLEAMAQGMLTIGTKDEGIDGILVDGVNGFLLDKNDEDGLADRIRAISRMTDEAYSRIAREGYETARAMTEENMATQYLENAVASVAHTDSPQASH